MRIESVQLKHTLHFSDITIHFEPKCAVHLILGAQSTGKTTLIRSCYQALTWFSARYKDNRSAGVVMLDQDIMHHRLQSKIDIQVRFTEDLGLLNESSNLISSEDYLCSWQLYKTLNSHGVGISKVETVALERLIGLYQQAERRDPLLGLPLIAYYPAERFVNEINLLNKNNPNVLHSSHAYDLTALPFTTFNRFFEWLREINDIENAQTTQMLQQLLQQHHADEEFFFSQKLAQSYSQMSAPALAALNQSLNTVLPDIQRVYLEYYPKLQLMVEYQNQTISFLQLSNSIRNLIALIGDIVRRLCLLNPNSPYPCQEGEGILLIDAIDHQLDVDMASVILNRLHQAFPRLQIIATGKQTALLENAEDFQCWQLAQQKLHTIKKPNIQFEQFFDQFSNHQLNDISDSMLETQEQYNLDEWQQQIQNQLSPEQQIELIQRLQDNQASNPDHLPSE